MGVGGRPGGGAMKQFTEITPEGRGWWAEAPAAVPAAGASLDRTLRATHGYGGTLELDDAPSRRQLGSWSTAGEAEGQGARPARTIDTPVDRRTTTYWAISSVISAGFIVGYSAFSLVNRETGRAHALHIPTGGLTTQLGPAAGGPASYTPFQTRRPANFDDFDGIGARVTSANIGVFWGYSIVYLTLWDGPAYFGKQLAYIKMGGWGAMIPGGSVAHGVTKITYGSGARLGTVPLILVEPPDDSSPEPRLASIRIAAMESPRINIPNELPFDFDSHRIKAAAKRSLLYLADLLNNRRTWTVEIEGHTDSIGNRRYNLELSRKRAAAVRDWFIRHKVAGARDFKVLAYGESQPVAPNKTPDGRDDPQGRRMNRRVVIKANWNV